MINVEGKVFKTLFTYTHYVTVIAIDGKNKYTTRAIVIKIIVIFDDLDLDIFFFYFQLLLFVQF